MSSCLLEGSAKTGTETLELVFSSSAIKDLCKDRNLSTRVHQKAVRHYIPFLSRRIGFEFYFSSRGDKHTRLYRPESKATNAV